MFTEKILALSNRYGFSLIEVLISLLLLSCIFIGFDVFCTHSVKGMRHVFYFIQAVNQIASMEERLRALDNHVGLNEQISAWNRENAIVLPKGIGEVTGIYPKYTLMIYWGNPPSECNNIMIGDSGCITDNFTI
jgi:prepilin-type N-terminal cleavage/methylation domain-containing protein